MACTQFFPVCCRTGGLYYHSGDYESFDDSDKSGVEHFTDVVYYIICTMFRIYSLIVVTEAIFLYINAQHIGIVIPWLGTAEIHGRAMGSSFLVAMLKRDYKTPFSLMPLNCEKGYSVISQV